MENMSRNKKYLVFAETSQLPLAKNLCEKNPSRFKLLPISWNKYPDGTDNIIISGYHPKNAIAGEHVLFFASFHNNDVTLSQFSVMIVLLQSFIESLTIVLPFFPVGTNERVVIEGHIATANTYSILLSNLPCIGKPNRLMLYDLHTLQNRFYFQNTTIASLHTTIPLLLRRLSVTNIDCVAFPDDGAAKRFCHMFQELGIIYIYIIFYIYIYIIFIITLTMYLFIN
jgi:phosphoribosylpyrophosphate synthetase